MSEETQTVDAGKPETEYFDLGADAPIQESESGEQQAPNPVEGLESFDENLKPPTFQDIEEVKTEEVPKDDASRFEYWQSRYDQKASENDTLKDQLGKYERISPIAEYIDKNPQILKGVARSLSEDTPEVAANGEPKESPKKPERPVKPANYDPSEAYMDSESASYKYRESIDNYRDSMIDYGESIEKHRIQELEAKERSVKEAQQQYRRQQDADGVRNDLVSKYGYTPEKAVEFLQYYSSPESITLDNLVKLDKVRSAPSQAEVEQRQKAESMKQKQGRMAVPPPAGVVSGQSESQLTDEDSFNLGLMQNRRQV